jgi:hypothetical protein
MINRAIGAVAMSMALLSTSAQAAVCLQSYDVKDTHVENAHTILFHMRDGSTWRNTLRNECPGLKWYGFVYHLEGTNEICSNMQSIRILRTHEVCLLGEFTPEAPPHHV